MTDETGGKPTIASLLASGYGGTMAKLMEADAAHTTIPTAALTELLAAAEEAIETITKSVDNDASFSRAAPHIRAQVTWTYTNRLRAAVARVRGE